MSVEREREYVVKNFVNGPAAKALNRGQFCILFFASLCSKKFVRRSKMNLLIFIKLNDVICATVLSRHSFRGRTIPHILGYFRVIYHAKN